MTNKEAYLTDLDDLKKEIDFLLSIIPVGKTKNEIQARQTAEDAAGRARATKPTALGHGRLILRRWRRKPS